LANKEVIGLAAETGIKTKKTAKSKGIEFTISPPY
jgi:hypothetical protein